MWPRMRSTTPRLLALLATLAFAAPLARADDPIDPPGRVARVSAALGTVSLQPAGSDTWVSDVLNRPLTNDDRLWADRESRAELHIGSTAVRIGSETGIGILNVDDRTVQLRLSAGALQARVRALEPDETMEIATPAASVAVLSPGSYHIDVNDRGDELRVSVRDGQVAVTDASGATTVSAGQQAIFRGSVNAAVVRSLPAGDGFDQWASERDRREDRSVSTRYVSRDTIGYEDLDDYGTWRTTDDYGPVWIPQVSVGWTPYRDGHWAWVAPWGWTWIDDAPWGFAPFHYGRWVRFHDQWCWTPGPRIGRPVYAPALVGWVGGNGWSVGIGIGGPPVGWFPLGWNEVYVPTYRYSRAYVTNINVTNIHVTNTYVTNYVDRRGPDRGEGPRFANMGVAGAVVVTSRDAFQGSQRVGDHLARLPAGALERARADVQAPALAPTRESLGRPARTEPPRRELFTRPVVSSMPAPRPAPSFENQRRDVVANGGRPVPIDRSTIARNPGDAARPDPVRAIRGPQASPADGRPMPAPRAVDAPRGTSPAPDVRNDRPPPGYRPAPPSEWRRDAPAADRAANPSPRPAPDARPSYAPPPRQENYQRPAPAQEPPARPAPQEYRPEPRPAAQENRPEPRPAPQWSPPPAPAREPPPVREYRPPAPPPAPPPAARPPAPPPAERAHPPEKAHNGDHPQRDR